jgi:hypothetical protein
MPHSLSPCRPAWLYSRLYRHALVGADEPSADGHVFMLDTYSCTAYGMSPYVRTHSSAKLTKETSSRSTEAACQPTAGDENA